jgi:uncharacterized protein
LPDACVEIVRRASLVVHTGDVTTAGALADLRSIGPRVEAVRGNVDEPVLLAELPERLVVAWEGLRIGVVHDGGAADGRPARLREWFPDCGLIAYGHSHAPELANHAGTWIVNPGSPTERRRAPAHTMAVVEEGVPRLITLL